MGNTRVIDDSTGEDISYLCGQLLENGATDAYATPVIMKKGRPGVELCVLSTDKKSTAEYILTHSTSLGLRYHQVTELFYRGVKK